jgi:SAM-dependent methyltransferase
VGDWRLVIARRDEMSGDSGPDGWWEDLYDERVAEVFLDRGDAELGAALGFLSDRLELVPGCRVFDQCCGIGSLSVPLAKSGIHVVAVDQSESYIRRARRRSEAAGVACEFHQADAFDYVTDAPCDAAFNWWTSFGYADTDRRNALMLRRAHESLRPGGWFVLDFQNMARILRDFLPCLVRRKVTGEGETLLLRESSLDLAGGFLRQQWTFLMPDGSRTLRNSAVRLYLPHTLAELLRDCGFQCPEFYGDLGGEPLTQDSPRCIVRARRPWR